MSISLHPAAHNIFEGDEEQLKIVRISDKAQNPQYFLIYQKLGTGTFGEVSRGIQLDVASGTTIPNTDVAIKITDFTEGGTLGKFDIQKAQKETRMNTTFLIAYICRKVFLLENVLKR